MLVVGVSVVGMVVLGSVGTVGASVATVVVLAGGTGRHVVGVMSIAHGSLARWPIGGP